MAYKDTSKRDIAKQFDLPERQSKIATLLKQNDVYCICRSTDSTRFMIACDYCEEWYHGDCINITESESRQIKSYFCPPCMEKNPSLEIEYKKSKTSSTVARKDKTKHEKKPGRPKKSSEPTSSAADNAQKYERIAGCGSCSGCLTVLNCGKCDRCKKAQKHGTMDRKPCRKRECIENDGEKEKQNLKSEPHPVLSERQIDGTDEEDDWIPSPKKLRQQKTTPSKKGRLSNARSKSSSGKQQKKGGKQSQSTKGKSRKKGRIQKEPTSSEHSEREELEVEEEWIQCYGLDCVNSARKGSKYCSDECGVKLATERLYRILPARIQEWNLSPCTAEEHNKKEMEDIRRKQHETRTAITELESKRAELDRHVQHVQQLTVDPDADDEEEEDGIIYCITCGHEIAVKTCLKHMERCYNKYESQTSFGSIYKTKLEGTPIFCDFYNPLNGTYCKRLKVLCPEHSKEPKVRDTEVCGCPLVKNLFEPTGEICRMSKKKCGKHFSWEKLRRAEIDMERVRHWLKLDELMEQERQIRLAMSSRAGVMGLLLHSTFDHELRARIQSQIKDGNLQKLRQKYVDQSNPEIPVATGNSSDQSDTPLQSEEEDYTMSDPMVKKRDKDSKKNPYDKKNKRE